MRDSRSHFAKRRERSRTPETLVGFREFRLKSLDLRRQCDVRLLQSRCDIVERAQKVCEIVWSTDRCCRFDDGVRFSF
jgi:hypothetical protein